MPQEGTVDPFILSWKEMKKKILNISADKHTQKKQTQTFILLYHNVINSTAGCNGILADHRSFEYLNWSVISYSVWIFFSDPPNISVSVDSEYIVEGSSVNLTCSSLANPAADNYTWYKRTESLNSSSLVQVGSGQVLTLASVEEAHAGLYLCYVRNSVGENSTEMMLVMAKQGLRHYFSCLLCKYS